jgi:hypothetical protein
MSDLENSIQICYVMGRKITFFPVKTITKNEIGPNDIVYIRTANEKYIVTRHCDNNLYLHKFDKVESTYRSSPYMITKNKSIMLEAGVPIIITIDQTLVTETDYVESIVVSRDIKKVFKDILLEELRKLVNLGAFIEA